MKNLLLLFAVFSLQLLSAQNGIYIDHSQKGAGIAKSMYGIFFEEINHSGDGGLYAELIQNRGFEEHVIPSGTRLENGRVYCPTKPCYTDGKYNNFNIAWNETSLKNTGWNIMNSKSTVSMEVVNETPLHASTPHSMKIQISDMQEGARISFRNSGYWGVPVKEGESYKLRFYLRTTDYAGTVTTKVGSGNNVYMEKEFQVDNSGNWVEYTATLTANGTRNTGTFQMDFNAEGTVWIDYVSLFPVNTFKNRENGLRADVAQFLADLKPAFIRWPGGCIVEGITIENRVKWKETIGDPMTRRGEFNLWGYRSTYGFGYHEFLQYCEDIGADGMFVANVGVSCRLRNGDYVELDELPAFIQDVRDAIDYAIADENNEWGAKRIANGHPEPFPLKYVELGNENWGAKYIEYYNIFYNALKPEYPEITFITTLGIDKDVELLSGVEMVDPHYYRNSDWFYSNSYLFDGVKRENYTAYVGEYACNQGVGSGNMLAALSEAAFICGMERNSDLVTMTSYAPLIENNNKRDWATNMIWLKNEGVIGRSSYYVQKMFGNHRPDYNWQTNVITDNMQPAFSGRIGLGTWKTAAQFKDFKIKKSDESRVFYEADFNSAQEDWLPFAGTWNFSGGAYLQTDYGTRRISMMNKWMYNDCVVEVKAMKTGGEEGFLIVFGAPANNLDKHYQLNIGGWANKQTAIESVTNGTGTVISDISSFKLENNRWYDIKLVFTGGNKVDCYVDNELIVSCAFNPTDKFQAIAGYDEATSETVIKVVNGYETAKETNIALNSRNINSTGKAITLSAPTLTSENSFANPELIAPVETSYTGFSNNFNYTFEPYSFTILRIKSDKEANGEISIPEWYSDEPVPVSQGTSIHKHTVDFKLFSNGNDMWTISNELHEIDSVTLTDTTGKQVFSCHNINKHAYDVDVKNLTTGIYLVEIVSNEGKVSCEKIMKK